MPVFRRLFLVLIVAVLAASCSSADTLATVNENEITKDDLLALRPSYESSNDFSSEQVRQDLSLLIVLEAIKDAAYDEFGYEMTEEDVDERVANPPNRYATVIGPPEQFANVAEAAIRASAQQTLVRDAVVPELAAVDADGFDNLFNNRPEEVTRSCVRHISSGSEADAQAVLARLEAGEDFATVAGEVSLDQASPGGLIANEEGECLVWLTRAGTDFARLAATVPLNTPAGPVVGDQEWNVILVEDRLAPASASALASDPMEWLDPDYISALYTPWLNDAVRNADIEVSPTVGRWSEAGIGIAPPGE